VFFKKVPRVISVGAVVGTAVVAAWLLLHAREDPPRGDRGPLALPSVPTSIDARDASSADAVVIDAP